MNGKKERETFAANLDRHVEEEGKALDAYRTLAGKLGDGSISFLIDLILTEEEQHHFLLRSMAKRIREPLEKETGGLDHVDRDELLQHTRRLWEHEQETINSCRALKSEIPVDEGDFFDGLLDAMILDSEKHQRLLSAVEKMIVRRR
jgi:rubrerythrin